MKTKISFILILIFTINIYSQTGTIKYNTTKVKPKKNVSKRFKKIYEEINRATYTLKYNKDKSFFSKDKILPLHPLEYKLAAVLVGANKSSYQFNKTIKESFINVDIKSKTYIVDNSKKMKDWVLENEIKIIDGYTCYKATKKNYISKSGATTTDIAWYTLEIPVPYGPAGYGGLPGLILQLQIGSRAIYLVKKIELNTNKNLKIKDVEKGEKISPEKFVQLNRAARRYTKD